MIWWYNFRGRCILLIPYNSHHLYRGNYLGTDHRRQVSTKDKILAILHVYTESRKKASRFYDLVSLPQLNGWKIWFDFSRDTVFFNNKPSINLFKDISVWGKATKFETKLKYMVFSANPLTLAASKFQSYSAIC
jgi:hypothetical protein